MLEPNILKLSVISLLDDSIGAMKVPSKDNIADIFTKPLSKCPFELFRAKLGLVTKVSLKGGC